MWGGSKVGDNFFGGYINLKINFIYFVVEKKIFFDYDYSMLNM
jgi:hypothetical protein